MVSTGKGYSKIILFGEHFVVYGLPGIASGIDRFVEIKIQPIEEDTIIIDDPTFFKEKVNIKQNPEHIKSKIFKPIIDKYNLNKIKITFNGDAIPGGGMGLSASLAVAMARATSDYLNLDLKDEEINELAFECEKVSHGTPSGIDNTCATYGTTILFEKNIDNEKNNTKILKCAKPLHLLIVDTGIKKESTKKIVEMVAKKKEENKKEFEKIFSDYKKIIVKAKQELKFGGIQEIGKLMNQNQELLRKIGVSCNEAEEIIRTVTFENCLGAKVTGAGCGGNVIVLCETEEQKNKIFETLKAKNYSLIKTKIS
ncbi:MAG: mevalonate kinase [Candidatus ainarchaeum sp.]|nr:mevalonate kinase [Candidatus ainarchaeum sp.]